MRGNLKSLCNSFSGIFFLNSPLVGAALLAATFINPNVSIAGIIAVLAAYLFARFLKGEKEFLASGFYTYNPLLVGLSIGYLFKINLVIILLVMSLGIFTFVISSFLYNIFSQHLKLPILSLPFAIASSITYLAANKYSHLLGANGYPHLNSSLDAYLPLWMNGYLKSFGAILFLPDSLVGLVLALVIFMISRILFLLTLTGYFSGTLVAGLMAGSFEQAFLNTNHFNYILIAMSLGGIFLIPGPKSYLLSTVAVIMAAVLLDSVQAFWSLYGLPVFTLPFILVALLFIYVLRIFKYPLVADNIQATPEETLDHYLTDLQRYKGSLTTLALPFSGKWTVWQGFDGGRTHKGAWRHACDFIITDSAGKAHRNEGGRLEDYYAYGKPVLSPVRGRIFKVVDSLPDNPIGCVDQVNNWGNLVIIQDPRGFFVELSHFAKDSIKVREGGWVERGDILGRCGNSGYSAQPHIHIQVQASETIGAHTLPFSFIGYLSNGKYHANELPEENHAVEPLLSDDKLDFATSFALDTCLRYEVLRDGEKIDEVRWVVRMSADGTFYFDSGKGKLYFGKHEGTFYLYRHDGSDPYMKILFQALPRLPLTYKPGMLWEDSLTVDSVAGGFQKSLALFLSSFNHDLNRVSAEYRYENRKKITGNIRSNLWKLSRKTVLEMDEAVGFKSIRVGNMELRKIAD